MKPRPRLIAASFVFAAALLAQTPPAPPPVNRDFDFWIGDWEVTTPDGRPAGTNRIESVSGGRGLLENWTGAVPPNAPAGTAPTTGRSLNAYDPAKQKWRQFWVGSGGQVLELAGGLVEGKMVMSAERTRRDGRAVIDRITWTPNADGTVRQHWEQSLDAGKTWTTAFDGLYRRKK